MATIKCFTVYSVCLEKLSEAHYRNSHKQAACFCTTKSDVVGVVANSFRTHHNESLIHVEVIVQEAQPSLDYISVAEMWV